jgi:uncharacterized membrane protein HdeD (DUF308 family)
MSSTVQAPNLFGHVWKAMLARGLLTLILGAAVLVWPGQSIWVASVLFGVYLILSGIAEIVFAFTLDISGGNRVLMFIAGALSLALGVLAFRNFSEGSAILLLAIWIGVAFIFMGVADTVVAISQPALPGRGSTVFMGVLSVIAGVIILAWPFGSIAVLALVAGIWLVVVGIAQIVSAFRARKEGQNVEQRLGRLVNGGQRAAA